MVKPQQKAATLTFVWHVSHICCVSGDSPLMEGMGLTGMHCMVAFKALVLQIGIKQQSLIFQNARNLIPGVPDVRKVWAVQCIILDSGMMRLASVPSGTRGMEMPALVQGSSCPAQIQV